MVVRKQVTEVLELRVGYVQVHEHEVHDPLVVYIYMYIYIYI